MAPMSNEHQALVQEMEGCGWTFERLPDAVRVTRNNGREKLGVAFRKADKKKELPAIGFPEALSQLHQAVLDSRRGERGE